MQTEPVVFGDAVFFHFALQGAALEAEPFGGSVGAADYSFGFTKDLENVLALRLLQRHYRRGSCGYRCAAEFRDWRIQSRTTSQDNGALDEVFQLTNIPRPMPLLKGFHCRSRY